MLKKWAENGVQNATYQTVQTDLIQTGVAFIDKKCGCDVGNEPVYDANGLDWVRQTAQSQIVGVESIAENFVGERQSRVKHRRGLMGKRLNIGKRD